MHSANGASPTNPQSLVTAYIADPLAELDNERLLDIPYRDLIYQLAAMVDLTRPTARPGRQGTNPSRRSECPPVTPRQHAAAQASCPQCIDNMPSYHHVHQAATLSSQARTESRIVVHGYAVGLDGPGGGLPQTWVFFKDLEPALVFGRAGRMSLYDIAGYGVYRAAHETRFDNTTGDDIETLHLIYGGESLDRQPDEAKAFQRWLRGVRPGSVYFHPPRTSHRKPTTRKAGQP